MSEYDWHDDAACRSTDPAIFFPDTEEEAKAARAVCSGCPVRMDCLDYANRTRQDFGIWGGLDEKQRRKQRSAGRQRRSSTLRADTRRAEASRLAAIGATVDQIANGLGVSHRTAQRYAYGRQGAMAS